MNVLDLIRAAGPLLWVLIALSLYVVYLVVLRLQVLSRLGGDPAPLVARAHSAFLEGGPEMGLRELDAAAQNSPAQGSPAARVLRAGLVQSGRGPEAATGAMNEAMLAEDARLYSGLSALGTVAQIAPLLGLLGTVFGMVRSFLVFSQTSQPTPTQLATGISEALVNTAGGLIVAILAYVARNALRSRADRIALSGERAREALLAWIHGRAPLAPAPRVPASFDFKPSSADIKVTVPGTPRT